MKDLKKIITKGIDDLYSNQQADGSFISLSSEKKSDFSQAKRYNSIFPSALILSCLNSLEKSPQMEKIRKKTASFLLAQKSEHWSFNYWMRNSEESREISYPDDLDDTFCSLAALQGYDKDLIDGKALAKIVILLTAVEEKEGGPYRTWLVPTTSEKIWLDVDLAVNSNIAFFLSLQDIFLENLNTFIEKAVEKKVLTSPYYPSEYPIIYFISRFYRGKKKETLINTLLTQKNKNGSWNNNVLDTALAISSLINFGLDAQKLISSIKFVTEKRWLACPICINFIKNKNKYYAGSSALTAAFCLEALTKYLSTINKKKEIAKNNPKKDILKQKIYFAAIKKAEKKCLSLKGELRNQAKNALEIILKRNKDKQIVLLPFFFRESLEEKGQKISDEIIIELCLANLYGWLAYTIYDDFLDDEGIPQALSAANVFFREMIIIFCQISPPESDFMEIFSKIMDNLDAANTWETTICRAKINNETITLPEKMPDYKNRLKLAERSLGHALGPIAILCFLGFDKNSKEIKNTISFFRHYIIARQLNDDSHDWEEDLKKGHLSCVCSAILNDRKKKSLQTQKTIDLKKNTSELQQLFWFKTAEEIFKSAQKHLEKAKKELNSISIIKNKEILLKLTEPIEKSMEKAVRDRREAIKFIKMYQ